MSFHNNNNPNRNVVDTLIYIICHRCNLGYKEDHNCSQTCSSLKSAANTPMPSLLTSPHKSPMGEPKDLSYHCNYLIFEAHRLKLPFTNTYQKSAASTTSCGLMGPLSTIESQTLRPPSCMTPSIMQYPTSLTWDLAHFSSSLIWSQHSGISPSDLPIGTSWGSPG